MGNGAPFAAWKDGEQSRQTTMKAAMQQIVIEFTFCISIGIVEY
jgi:hypothetical protein